MEGLKITSMYQAGSGEIQFDGRLPSTAESVAWLAKHWGINVELEYPASGAMAPIPPAPDTTNAPAVDETTTEVELPVGATEEKPKRGRGRKAAKEAEKPAEEEKPKRGRGRKAAKQAEEKPKVSEQTPKLSNAELAKAMSQAAGKVGPEEAMAVLAEFKVERVSEIPKEDREDFLQTLRILCDG